LTTCTSVSRHQAPLRCSAWQGLLVAADAAKAHERLISSETQRQQEAVCLLLFFVVGPICVEIDV
jgi:hypothetical protein